MRGIHIQRPTVLTEKQKMYGDVVHSTQGHQHAYECVQPLQGLITFGEPEEIPHYNNLSRPREDRPYPEIDPKKLPHYCLSLDTAIYCMLAVKFVIVWFSVSVIDKQTAYNDVYLTYFMPSGTGYNVEAGGKTNALNCLVIAASLVIFSVIIGLTSKQYKLNFVASISLFSVLVIMQLIALVLHIYMLIKQSPDLNYNCLTTLSMLILHILTFILSVVGLGLLAAAPLSNETELQARIASIEQDKKTAAAEKARIAQEHEPENKNDFSDLEYLKKISQQPAYPEQSFEETTLLKQEDIYAETTVNFWLCVVEDLNTILCYAFVVRTCDAQSAIHDDSTTFFDVLCIVFLGFLQHVANILMVFHAHIHKQTKLKMMKKSDEDKQGIKSQAEELMTFIAHTRLLLFFLIDVSVSFVSLTHVRAIPQLHTVRDVPRPGHRDDGVSEYAAQLLVRVPERKHSQKAVEHIAHLEARRTVPHSTVFFNYGSVQHNHRQERQHTELAASSSASHLSDAGRQPFTGDDDIDSQLEILDDADDFVLWHLEQVHHLLIRHRLNVVRVQRKVDPLSQREIKVWHNSRVHTFRAQLLVRDLHLREQLCRPPLAPHFGQVRVQVRERVHREAHHVRQVRELQGAAVDLLLRRRLDQCCVIYCHSKVFMVQATRLYNLICGLGNTCGLFRGT
jgi:hypothetical protein